MKLFKTLPRKALLLTTLFSLAYIALGLIKHNHFLSGYDLAVSDQVMWKYAYLHNPLTTIHAYPFTYLMADHVEFIYIFLAPLFWIWNNVQMIIIMQALFFCISGVPMYLLARKKGLNELLSLTLLFSYLFFFGVQNALWNDVHSNVFGAGFLAWMIYFLESGNAVWTGLTFFLAITSKEDMAFLTFAIGTTWLIKNMLLEPSLKQKAKNWTSLFAYTFSRNKLSLGIIAGSLCYLSLIFVVYFPHFTPQGYRFSAHEPLLASLNMLHFADTASKREIIVYSLGWFGFLPFFAPLFLLPWFADLFHFFVIGHLVESAQEIFLHYRVTLAPLLLWPTIVGISFLLRVIPQSGRIEKSKNSSRLAQLARTITASRLQFILALYLLVCAFTLQYALHLPLSYFTKSWFWHSSPSVASINHVLTYLPQGASVVSQNNITPHVGHRDLVFTLWSSTRGYKTLQESPCGRLICPWFHWVGNPQYMIVDTSPDWDIRHLLQNRPDFLNALQTFEDLHKIVIVHREGTTTLYRILQNP